MANTWLIRTAENKIFGPVSSTKILDLISRGSLKKSDEISAGNGYWFFVKESELIHRFLKENKKQPFNPINEAQDVEISSYEMDFVEQTQSVKFPEAEDLEYPTMGGQKGSTMAKVDQETEEPEVTFGEKKSLPSQDDLEYPVEDDDNSLKKIAFDINEFRSASEDEKGPENFPKGEDSEYPD